MQIGEKIRKKRLEGGIKLIDVAAKTGYSQSYLSQIERGIINPSVGALQKIASGLGLPTATFFDTEEDLASKSDVAEVVRVVRKNERKGLIYPSSNISYQLLSPDLKGAIEFLMITSPPGGSTGEERFVHEGQEYGVILQGTIELWVGDEQYILQEGDSVYFNSSNPHSWRNCGDKDLIAVWAVTPPSF